VVQQATEHSGKRRRQKTTHEPQTGFRERKYIKYLILTFPYCFVFFKPYSAGIQDKFVTYMKLKGTCNK